MKLLIVSKLDRSARAVQTIARYVQVSKELGHEVAVFGEQRSEPPALPTSLDVKKFDFALFVVYTPADFPDLPYLAQLLDGVPKDRRILIDCTGRYNETIRVEHDFNHHERIDGHQGWEWIEGFQAVAGRILQPTLTPRRDDVQPFLFHGFYPEAVARPYASAREAADAWSGKTGATKRFAAAYVGNNWQRWSQLRRFLEAAIQVGEVGERADSFGPIALAGWDWNKRPDWAVQLNVQGVDVDLELLQRAKVETRTAIPFDQAIDFVGQGRFAPIMHRPLYNELGLVTNRTFETFCADSIPVLMLPVPIIERIYGPAAVPLAGDDLPGRLRDMLRRPEFYWDAVLRTRAYLSRYHSYVQRYQELLRILEG